MFPYGSLRQFASAAAAATTTTIIIAYHAFIGIVLFAWWKKLSREICREAKIIGKHTSK